MKTLLEIAALFAFVSASICMLAIAWKILKE